MLDVSKLFTGRRQHGVQQLHVDLVHAFLLLVDHTEELEHLLDDAHLSLVLILGQVLLA